MFLLNKSILTILLFAAIPSFIKSCEQPLVTQVTLINDTSSAIFILKRKGVKTEQQEPATITLKPDQELTFFFDSSYKKASLVLDLNQDKKSNNIHKISYNPIRSEKEQCLAKLGISALKEIAKTPAKELHVARMHCLRTETIRWFWTPHFVMKKKS